MVGSSSYNEILNQVICGNSSILLQKLPESFVDLTITSPPYSNKRDYHGFDFDFENIAKGLFRVTKEGGVVVWVVGDHTKNGDEEAVPFVQALLFKSIGFRLHDTMIYEKNCFFQQHDDKYVQNFEYMFVLAKGPKINFFTPLVVPTNPNHHNTTAWSTKRLKKGSTRAFDPSLKEHRPRGNVWSYDVGYCRTTPDRWAYDHPAMFPEKLAEDHILSWSKPGDIVLDPMCGAGTTLKMAAKHQRLYLGIDISETYCELSKRRVTEGKI
jgi:DNA modification methylase